MRRMRNDCSHARYLEHVDSAARKGTHLLHNFPNATIIETKATRAFAHKFNQKQQEVTLPSFSKHFLSIPLKLFTLVHQLGLPLQ